MPKRSQPMTANTAETAMSEIQRHIAALKLSSVHAYQTWCRENGFGASLHKNWRQRQQELACAARLEAYVHACSLRAEHIRKLGLESLESYATWCRCHGFSDSLYKGREQWEQELRAAERERAAQALMAARRLHHKPEELIRAIYEKRVPWSALRNAYQQKIHQLFAGMKERPRAQEALLRLLRLSKTGDLLSVEPAIAYLGPQPGNTFPDGLFRLALRHREWIRAPEDWKPELHNARRQFSALTRHLLARYDVPLFLDAAWFEGDNETARQHQQWFMHIGQGQNIRTAELPVALTKKAAHHFLQAPRDITIVGALRWGQIHGMGGDEYLARAICGSRLAEILPDEPFWATVLQFFASQPRLASAQIGPMMDYIYHQKFVFEEILGPRGVVTYLGPPQPEFSMKGRTEAALQRLVEAWHVQLAREPKRPRLEWAPAGIGAFRLLQRGPEDRVSCWIIEELLSSKELQEEGKAMHNCVAAYSALCAQGRRSIWSLKLATSHDGVRHHVLTIEVDTARRSIVQVRGPCNQHPEGKQAGERLQTAMEMLRRWAEQQNLSITRYV
ncbi:MAG TPA: PcfJ domain-containing protein [Chthonomonadaceae bacterium]|nr:PcfJ domain-containing protein [Chthonomonadaceae bacterium]